MRLVRFDDYIFPAQSEFSTNFGDVLLRAARLPGRDGGFDPYGAQQAPKEVGNIRTAFWLEAATPAIMRGLVDEVYGLIAKGRKRLYIDPMDGGGQRYATAKVNNISVAESVREVPHKLQRVEVNFQAVEAYWIGAGAATPTWGGGFTWGSGAFWGGSTTPYSVSGTSTDITITNPGSAPTHARITMTVGTGDSAENPVIRRIVSGATVDQVSYTGTLGAGDVLDIRSRSSQVLLNGSAAYANFAFTRGHWIMLEPGENTLRFIFANAGDAVDEIKVRYLTRFY